MAVNKVTVTVNDLLYSYITPGKLYSSYVPDEVSITILGAGSLNHRKKELAMFEMFFYKRLVRYNFEKLSQLLPKMIFRLNMASIFMCAVLYNENLSREQKKSLLFDASALAMKIEIRDDWKTSLQIVEIRESDIEIVGELRSAGTLMTKDETELWKGRHNKTLRSIEESRKKKSS